MPIRLTQEIFETKVKQKYQERFCLRNFKYINMTTKGVVRCTIHDEVFEVTPDTLLSKRVFHGCSLCKKKSFQDKRGKGSEFVERANKIHNNKYDYSKFVYVNNKTNGTVICKTCKHEWETRPDTHLFNKSGCKVCNVAQIYTKEYYLKNGIPDHKVYLYLLKFESKDQVFCKIGLTKHEKVKYRFRGSDYSDYNIQQVLVHETTFFNAYDIEQALKIKYSSYSFVPKTKFKGKTECFDIKILPELIEDFTESVLHNRNIM